MTARRSIICSTQGAIDLQINGALGISFNDLNSDRASRIPEISQFFISTRDRWILNPLEAKILGVHLEGLFLRASNTNYPNSNPD